MSNELIEKLKKTRRIGNVILANKIAKVTYPIQSDKDFKKDSQNRRKAYELFLKLIDDHSRKELIDTDFMIHNLTEYIEEQSGWWNTDVGFMYIDRCYSSKQRVFSNIKTYVVARTKNGYEPSSRSFSNGKDLISSREEYFYEYFQNQLRELHNLYCKKEEIMGGTYTLKDSTNEELAKSISTYLIKSSPRLEEEKTFYK